MPWHNPPYRHIHTFYAILVLAALHGAEMHGILYALEPIWFVSAVAAAVGCVAFMCRLMILQFGRGVFRRMFRMGGLGGTRTLWSMRKTDRRANWLLLSQGLVFLGAACVLLDVQFPAGMVMYGGTVLAWWFGAWGGGGGGERREDPPTGGGGGIRLPDVTRGPLLGGR